MISTFEKKPCKAQAHTLHGKNFIVDYSCKTESTDFMKRHANSTTKGNAFKNVPMKEYHKERSSQAKKTKKSSTFYDISHNFNIRGSSHLINVNSKHVRAQINSRRRTKAREKSVELGRAVRIFDDETRLTSRELMKVLENKEVKIFRNGASSQLNGSSTYISGPFNPHKAKKIYANPAQKEAGKYFRELMLEKFHSLKKARASDVLSIREEAIEKVLEKYKDHQETKAIMVYVKNLWMTYDEHLYDTKAMKEKADRHIEYIIKNASPERAERLRAAGATPEEVYQTLRTVQGYNMYHLRLLAERGGAAVEIHIRKETMRRLKYVLNGFKYRMIKMGVVTKKDFFLIARRHLPFLFNKKYVQNRNRMISRVRRTSYNPFKILEDYARMCELLAMTPYRPPD